MFAEVGLIFIPCSVIYLPDIYRLKINNRNPRTRCEVCSKLTIKPSKGRRSGVFIVNFEHISQLVLVFLLLTLNMLLPAGNVLIISYKELTHFKQMFRFYIP